MVRESDDPSRANLVFVQRSWFFRFPDTIWVQAVPLGGNGGNGGTGLIVYSASNYGWGDGGVNRARIERWIAKLGRELVATPAVVDSKATERDALLKRGAAIDGARHSDAEDEAPALVKPAVQTRHGSVTLVSPKTLNGDQIVANSSV